MAKVTARNTATDKDEVRRDEARRLKQDGYEPVLKNSRWCLLKRPENLTDKQTVKLAELLRCTITRACEAICCCTQEANHLALGCVFLLVELDLPIFSTRPIT
jgi:hypothetical protein